jgi:hypothetical protein
MQAKVSRQPIFHFQLMIGVYLVCELGLKYSENSFLIFNCSFLIPVLVSHLLRLKYYDNQFLIINF